MPRAMRVDRLLGEHGMGQDSAARRQEFERQMERRRLEALDEEAIKPLQRGWPESELATRRRSDPGMLGHCCPAAERNDPADQVDCGLESLAFARFWWDAPLMTVTADAKRRVVLPPAKPGDRFDVQLSTNGKLVLTPLIPDERFNKVKLVKKHGYTVAVTSRPITQAQTRAYLDEFP
jgi:hypothetical protein